MHILKEIFIFCLFQSKNEVNVKNGQDNDVSVEIQSNNIDLQTKETGNGIKDITSVAEESCAPQHKKYDEIIEKAFEKENPSVAEETCDPQNKKNDEIEEAFKRDIPSVAEAEETYGSQHKQYEIIEEVIKPTSTKNAKHNTKFQSEWTDKNPWLKCKKNEAKEVLFCQLCSKHLSNSPLYINSPWIKSGFATVRLDKVNEHKKSEMHRKAVEAETILHNLQSKAE